MAKKIRIVLTLQLPAGKATPAPPVGTALGPHGINIVEFTKAYNEKTADKAGQVIPAQITIFEDRSFTFVLKTPPAPDLLRKAAGVDKGSSTPKRETAGRVTREQVRQIAEIKLVDLNVNDIEAGMKVIEGNGAQERVHPLELAEHAGPSWGVCVDVADVGQDRELHRRQHLPVEVVQQGDRPEQADDQPGRGAQGRASWRWDGPRQTTRDPAGVSATGGRTQRARYRVRRATHG